MSKRTWLIVAGSLIVAACGRGSISEPLCETQEGSQLYGPCNAVGDPAEAPAPSVGDPNEP